jgi:3-isopropylmalate/(R)-2-methylmalate dehydratase small subunit
MECFTRFASVAAPLARANVDTDQVIPARYLQKPRAGGFGQFLFHDLRYDPAGAEYPDFVLNQAPFRDARILVADANFGCGSSRENAVWAMADYGFRAVIAPSFGDIFSNNGLRNGLLPIRLASSVVTPLLATLVAAPGSEIDVDLAANAVTLPDGSVHNFEIDPFLRRCLLEGLDELDFTLSQMADVEAFEHRYGRHNA